MCDVCLALLDCPHGSTRGCPYKAEEAIRTLLEFIYQIPDELRSEEELNRRFHRDLAAKDLAVLRFELNRLAARLHVDTTPDPWLLERLGTLKEAIDRAAE